MLPRLLHGAVLGGLVSLALLAVGAARYAVAALAGSPLAPPTVRDLGLGAGYVLAFAVAGAVVEALGRLRRSRDGAMLVGLVGALPVAFGVGLILAAALDKGGPSLWVGCGLWALIVGPIVGWHHLYRPEEEGAGRLPEPRLRTVRPPGPRPPET